MLKLIGFVAILCLTFFAGMQYQKSKVVKQLVAEKVQQKVDQLVEKIK